MQGNTTEVTVIIPLGSFTTIYSVLGIILLIGFVKSWLQQPAGTGVWRHATSAAFLGSGFFIFMAIILAAVATLQILLTVVMPLMLIELLKYFDLLPPRPPASVPT